MHRPKKIRITVDGNREGLLSAALVSIRAEQTGINIDNNISLIQKIIQENTIVDIYSPNNLVDLITANQKRYPLSYAAIQAMHESIEGVMFISYFASQLILAEALSGTKESTEFAQCLLRNSIASTKTNNTEKAFCLFMLANIETRTLSNNIDSKIDIFQKATLGFARIVSGSSSKPAAKYLVENYFEMIDPLLADIEKHYHQNLHQINKTLNKSIYWYTLIHNTYYGLETTRDNVARFFVDKLTNETFTDTLNMLRIWNNIDIDEHAPFADHHHMNLI